MLKHCPGCKSPNLVFEEHKRYHCTDCNFTYYQNVAAAVMGILKYQDKILMVVRNKVPEKGKLDCVGGFASPDEAIDTALIRETREELGLIIDNLKYIGSYPNNYHYKGTDYKTCDMIFEAEITTLPVKIDETEIKAWKLVYPKDIKRKDVAFESVWQALKMIH